MHNWQSEHKWHLLRKLFLHHMFTAFPSLFFWLQHNFSLLKMQPKRAATFSDLPPQRRLRANLSDLFLGNAVSAPRAGELFRDAEQAGAAAVEDLVKIGSNSKQGQVRHRDLRRAMLKNRHWPSLYIFNAPGLCPETQEEQLLKIPMLLPHEIMAALEEKLHTSHGFFDHRDLAPGDQERLAAAARHLHTEVSTIAGLGLWGDGVPYSSDRTKSIEVLALNIVTHKDKDLRFPIAIIPKHWMLKNATYDAIFAVVKWSFTCLAMACWPATDHAGHPWGVGQSSRKKKAGQPLPRAILLQVRGDWSFYKNTLYLPAWILVHFSRDVHALCQEAP